MIVPCGSYIISPVNINLRFFKEFGAECLNHNVPFLLPLGSDISNATARWIAALTSCKFTSFLMYLWCPVWSVATPVSSNHLIHILIMLASIRNSFEEIVRRSFDLAEIWETSSFYLSLTTAKYGRKQNYASLSSLPCKTYSSWFFLINKMAE